MGEVTLSSRPGKISRVLRRSVRDARDAGRMTPSGEVFAAIAERTADLADAAFRADDVKLLTTALRDLRMVVARLPLDEPALEPGPADDGGSGAEPGAAELAELMGSGPVVGHGSESGAAHLRAAGRADR